MQGISGLSDGRVMIDLVARYGTVVVEAEAPSLADFREQMAATANRPEIRQAMAGYMEMVEQGHREGYRLVWPRQQPRSGEGELLYSILPDMIAIAVVK